MAPKRKYNYKNFEERKQLYTLNYLGMYMSEYVSAFYPEWEDDFLDITGISRDDDLTTKVTDDPKSDKQGKMNGIDTTANAFLEDQTDAINKIKKGVKKVKKNLDEYDGPFKEIMEAELSIMDPSSGDILELYLDNPVLEKLLVGISGRPAFTDDTEVEKTDPETQKKKTVTAKRINTEKNNWRKEQLKTIGQPMTDYFVAVAELFKIEYERQKELKKPTPGIASVKEKNYLKKYINAIEDLDKKYNKLVEAHKEYLKDEKLSRLQRELQYVETEKIVDGEKITVSEKVLNNDLSDITDGIPKKVVNRNSPVATHANLRGQAQAARNGWKADELGVLGFIEETYVNTEHMIDQYRKQYDDAVKALPKAEERYNRLKNTDPASINNYADELRDAETQYNARKNERDKASERINDREPALKDIKVIRDKYFKMKNPNYFEKKEVVREVKAFFEKYKDKEEVLLNRGSAFIAFMDKNDNVHGFEGKTRQEQAESMMKSLKDVNSLFRSSQNFRDIIVEVEKLINFTKKHPELDQNLFREYEKQIMSIRKMATKYIKGKEKEAEDYKKKKGHAVEYSEYTSNRINTVMDVLDQANELLYLNSDPFTKEYTGNTEERAFSAYQRIIREEEQYRIDNVAINVDDKSINTKLIDSFYKSLYVEKMKIRYETDPKFTADDFYKSLQSSKVRAGAAAERKLFNNNGFYGHLKDVIEERGTVGDDKGIYDPEAYKAGFGDEFALEGKVPAGFGQDWVKFELNYYMNVLKNNPDEKKGNPERLETVMKEYGYAINDDIIIENAVFKDLGNKPAEEEKKGFDIDKFINGEPLRFKPKTIDEYRYYEYNDIKKMIKELREEHQKKFETGLSESDEHIFSDEAEKMMEKLSGSDIEATEIRLGLRKAKTKEDFVKQLKDRYDESRNAKLFAIEEELKKLEKIENVWEKKLAEEKAKREELGKLEPGDIIMIDPYPHPSGEYYGRADKYLEVLGVENGVIYFKSFDSSDMLNETQFFQDHENLKNGGITVEEMMKLNYKQYMNIPTDAEAMDYMRKNHKKLEPTPIKAEKQRKKAISAKKDNSINSLEEHRQVMIKLYKNDFKEKKISEDEYKNKLDEADKKFKDDSAKVKENLKTTQSRLDNREENLKIAKDTYQKAMNPEVQKNVKTEVRKAPTGMKK